MPDVTLTNSEWYVLDCLWEHSPLTVMELVERLSQKVGWAKSTTITTLRRMEEKGLVPVSYTHLSGISPLFPAWRNSGRLSLCSVCSITVWIPPLSILRYVTHNFWVLYIFSLFLIVRNPQPPESWRFEPPLLWKTMWKV